MTRLSALNPNEIPLRGEVHSEDGLIGEILSVSGPINQAPFDGDHGITIRWSSGWRTCQPLYLLDHVSLSAD